ncbi:poly(A) polymerase [Devosia pacifica]|uniref:Poly(A) polymerase n=1 Tax=Devosia pacifica TaxID=1335967 RepID=A0A918VRY1_9HYPH|nr:CCA tRNA nucleotidyltransferase [Devosia pacifica]GHA17426.1 poly(A) polymerase [Devosia pacifica]
MTGAATAESRLRLASWRKNDNLQRALALLDGDAGRSRIVGGLVRDTILDVPRTRRDVDIATEFEPDTVIERAEAGGFKAIPTGIEHGTITLKRDDDLFEVTTLREDVKTDGRHAVVQFGQDWHADASRRDFTLNALYSDIEGQLFDPIEGLSDCLNARVRFIGEAARRIAEDGLRVYRFFRFTISHGQDVFDPEGLAACSEAAGKLGHLSGERVGVEMRRILELPRITVGLRRMSQIGLVDVDADVMDALTAYERQVAEPSFLVRLCLLAKARPIEELQRLWRLPNSEIDRCRRIGLAAGLVQAMKLYEAIVRYPRETHLALDLASISAGWSAAGKQAVSDQLEAIEPAQFPVSGRDLLERGLPPGPALGQELSRLERLWLDSGLKLSRDTLLESAKTSE